MDGKLYTKLKNGVLEESGFCVLLLLLGDDEMGVGIVDLGVVIIIFFIPGQIGSVDIDQPSHLTSLLIHNLQNQAVLYNI